MYINLNHERLKLKKNADENYKEAVTNVLLGFLQGLINHHARLKGLAYRVDRRQSFGFLRTTITDAGEFRLRLSFGVESDEFKTVILASLKDFYQVVAKINKFDAQVTKMRSEDKQWQAQFEAQHYLKEARTNNETGYVATAYTSYLSEFAVADKRKVNKPETEHHLEKSKNAQEKVKMNESPVFSLLQNLTKFAVNFAAHFDEFSNDSELKHFQQAFLHDLAKLHLHCNNAVALLQKLKSKELTIAVQEAMGLVDNIIEYLIALDSLKQIQAKAQGLKNTKIQDYCDTEAQYVQRAFFCEKDMVQVYMSDSGQQAITSSLLAMDFQMYLSDEVEDRGSNHIYNFAESYFELDSFLKDVGGLTTDSIVDTTRNPNMSNAELKALIATAKKHNKWVLLVASSLKHDQLGADKYTTGKIVTIAPSSKVKLEKDVTDIFSNLSKQTMHPAIASYLQMVNQICGDKMPTEQPQLNKTASQALQHFSVHKAKKAVKKPEINLAKNEILSAKGIH